MVNARPCLTQDTHSSGQKIAREISATRELAGGGPPMTIRPRPSDDVDHWATVVNLLVAPSATAAHPPIFANTLSIWAAVKALAVVVWTFPSVPICSNNAVAVSSSGASKISSPSNAPASSKCR